MLAVLAPVLLVITACTSGATDVASEESNTRGESATDSSGDLIWGGCQQETASMAGLQCTTLSVPIDREAPEGDKVDLTLARVPASGDPSERIGSLLFNPGGPGGSGIEFLAGASLLLPEQLQERFDLVSWDPRGVGQSTPVRCLTDAQKQEQTEGDLSPDDQAELEMAIEDQEEFLRGCEDNNPELIGHMSTADVAGDMEEIRVALGDEKLNYVGFSYGTAIGATYATLFPQQVRAMVLDGSVSPTESDVERTTAQVQGFERTYLSFVATCDADPRCALSGRTADTVDEVRSRLDTQPLAVDTTSGRRELTRDLFDLGLGTALYDTTIWGPLGRAIDDIDGNGDGDGDGAELILSLADRQSGRNPDGTWDNSSDAQRMVSCADTEERLDVNAAVDAGEEIAAAAPTFGDVGKTAPLACVNWPLPANPVPEWTAAGAPPILVVGTVGDPATPYEWSQQMTEALQGSVLLTYEGDGHTAFMRGGPCIDDAVVAYLVDLAVPKPGTSCPATTQEAGAGVGRVREQLLDELAAAGIPEQVATCIVDSLEDDLGTSGLEDLLLGGDPEELTDKITGITLDCMSGG